MPRFEQLPFRDLLFRQKRKHDTYRIVDAPVLETGVADTHTHLQLLPDPAFTLARCAGHNVSFVCTIVDVVEDDLSVFDRLDVWQAEAQEVAQELLSDAGEVTEVAIPRVRIAVGCHPHNAKDFDDAAESLLRRHLRDPRVCALGEIGLDYHYDFSPRDQQCEVFRRQLRMAKEAGLPVVLHLREAHDEALALMQEEGFPQAGTLLHCFNLDWETLKPWVEAGCHIAFGGPLTFKSTDEVRDAALRVPLDRLLTETDAPYMTPEPMRGMMCGTDHVIFTAERMARVWEKEPGISRQQFLEQLMSNALNLLDREPTAWQKQSE